MTGADIIVQVLADEGVDTIFGYSGGAVLPSLHTLTGPFATSPESLAAP